MSASERGHVSAPVRPGQYFGPHRRASISFLHRYVPTNIDVLDQAAPVSREDVPNDASGGRHRQDPLWRPITSVVLLLLSILPLVVDTVIIVFVNLM